MAAFTDIDWSRHDFKQYSYNLLLVTSIIFSPLIILCTGLFMASTLYITVRFCMIKFGKKIRPDGSRAILITGATSGIGLMISKHFYKIGFSVFACYYNDQEPGYKELLELSLQPYENVVEKRAVVVQRPGLFLVRMDVRSQESIESSSREVNTILVSHKMKLCYLINNAGLSTDAPFEWLGLKWVRDIMDTNIMGILLVTKQFLFQILQNKGRVINVSSGCWALPTGGISLYGSSKIAVAYMSTCFNEDFKRYGASCISVMPGNFITSSNIIYPRYKCMQDSVSKLNDAERALYSSSIEEYWRFMDHALRVKMKTSKHEADQVRDLFQMDPPDLNKPLSRKAIKKRGYLMRAILSFVSLLDGGGEGKPLENSGIKESYELAVRMVNPPDHLYAGNRMWTYISGPLLEMSFPLMHNWIGNFASKVLKIG